MSATPAPRFARSDLRTLGLASLGGALEYYDFIIFVFFTQAIGQLFFPPDTPDWLRQLQAFGLFAAGYLARPLGGILMAHFGDRSGRKRMFLLSVLLMALPTLAIGLMPTYASIGHAAPIALLLLRILQGAAVGGEVPGAWVFVAEHAPPHRTGFACGVLTAGLTLGILLGSLVAGAVTTTFGANGVLEWAWRLPFLLGGVFGLGAVWLRRYLDETPVFEELRRRRGLVAGVPLARVLRGHGDAVALSMLLTVLLTAGIVVVILMTPTFAQKPFGIPAATALGAGSHATAALTVGCIVFGLAADRFGPSRVLLAGALVLPFAAALLYLVMAVAPQHYTAAYTLAGFCVGVVGVVPTAMVRAFPAAIRFSGISFAYNVAYALAGGLTPLLVSWWMRFDSYAPVYHVAIACAVGMLAASAWGGATRSTPAAGDAAA